MYMCASVRALSISRPSRDEKKYETVRGTTEPRVYTHAQRYMRAHRVAPSPAGVFIGESRRVPSKTLNRSHSAAPSSGGLRRVHEQPLPQDPNEAHKATQSTTAQMADLVPLPLIFTAENDCSVYETVEEQLRQKLRTARQYIKEQEVQVLAIQGCRLASQAAVTESPYMDALPLRRAGDLRRLQSNPIKFHDLSREFVGELVEKATLALRQNMDDTLSAAAKAREHSIQCEAEGAARLEEALRRSSGPNAEGFIRQVARSSVTRANKSLSALRAAMLRLEEVADSSLRTSAADVAGTVARLLAQREASLEAIRCELEHAESEGAHSIRGLELEVRRLREESTRNLDTRDATIAALQARLAEAEQELDQRKGCQRSDKAEIARLRGDTYLLRNEVRGLEQNLSRVSHELQAVTREVAVEEDGRAADARYSQQQLTDEIARKEAERAATERALNARLEANGLATKNAKESIDKMMRLEAGMNDQLQQLKRSKEEEGETLQCKIDLLGQQIAALHASRSTSRSRLYWTCMQTPGSSPDKTSAMMEALQLDDPEPWLQWKDVSSRNSSPHATRSALEMPRSSSYSSFARSRPASATMPRNAASASRPIFNPGARNQFSVSPTRRRRGFVTARERSGPEA